MALVSIGSAGTMVKQLSNAIGSNAITNALGIDFGGILTPNKFLTKFSPSTVFAYRSLAYELRTAKNFDVIFHWFPRRSQIRSMFSNAFSASDTDEINLLVQSVQLPPIVNSEIYGNMNLSNHMRCAFPGSGVNGGGNLNMSFLNTEFSYIAHCFYQWISETESPFWIYGPSVMIGNKETTSLTSLKTLGESSVTDEGKKGQISQIASEIEAGAMSSMIYLQSESEVTPFTRADIEIKYYSANMKELHSVWFMGAFPVSIMLENLDNKPGTEDAHTVTFTYDSTCISTPFTKNSSNSITNATLGALNGAASAIGGSNTAAWTAGLYDDTLTQIGNTYLDKLSKKLNKITNEAGSKLSEKLSSWQKKLTA